MQPTNTPFLTRRRAEAWRSTHPSPQPTPPPKRTPTAAKVAARLLFGLPVLAAGVDLYLWHFPFYAGCAILGLGLLVLAWRAWDWCKPRLHRAAAATLLLFCHPRKNHEPRLHAFCYPDHA